MKKKLAKLLVLALVLSAVPALTPAWASEARNLRVGLFYGSNTLAAASLVSGSETGFRFGYYDGDRNFVPLGWTEEPRVSVLITQNQYLTAKGGYSYSSQDSKGTVGCYHVHLPWTYQDFPSAKAAAEQVENGFVAWVEGAYYVRMGSYNRRADAEEAAAALGVEGACLGETGGYGYCAVATGTDRILFQFDANVDGEAGAFGVEPGLVYRETAVDPESGEEVMLETSEPAVDAVTSFGGNVYRGGFRFERIGGGESTVVNMVDLDNYIRGILPYEMSASWPLEALKAQAVSARSYSLYHSSRHKSDHFDLCTTTHCQVYQGTSRASANSDRAVDETAGLLALYNGKVIDAVYYSSNGGGTEDAKNVWGTDLGYLKGKEDPYEADIADIAGNYTWSVTSAKLKTTLNNNGYKCGDIVDIATKQSATGNVIEIKLTDAAGKSYTFARDKVRTSLGLNSIRFTVEKLGGEAPGFALAGTEEKAPDLEGLYALSGDGSVSQLSGESYVLTADGVQLLEPEEGGGTPGEASFVLRGNGWGHNVGLSQWGAYAMAKRGYTFDQILKFYYTDITIE